jgi:hypothetical protein
MSWVTIRVGGWRERVFGYQFEENMRDGWMGLTGRRIGVQLVEGEK